MLTETLIEGQTPPPTGAAADWTIPQHWERFTAEEHRVWDTLFARQQELLQGQGGQRLLQRPRRAAPVEARHSRSGRAQRAAVRAHRLDDRLRSRPRTRRHLLRASLEAPLPRRQFHPQPQTASIISSSPTSSMTCSAMSRCSPSTTVADFMQAMGAEGLAALRAGALHRLARLYWYSVEFGLAKADGALRIYGAGLLSSFGESHFSLESETPKRRAVQHPRGAPHPLSVRRLPARLFRDPELRGPAEAADRRGPRCALRGAGGESGSQYRSGGRLIRHCERSEAIQCSGGRSPDCFVAMLLALTDPRACPRAPCRPRARAASGGRYRRGGEAPRAGPARARRRG